MNIPTRRDIITEAKANGKQIAAVMPFHYPRALLRAFDIHPMEVWGPPHVDDMAGSQHFPEYTCKIVTKAIQFLKSDQANDVDIFLMPHTCDSLQGMASVMRDHVDTGKPVLTLYHPRGRRQSDRHFLKNEITRLFNDLRKITGKNPSDDHLRSAIDAEDQALSNFCRIAENREKYALSDRKFFTALRSREFLPAEDFTTLANDLPLGKPELKGPGILISGIVPEPMELFDFINEYGAHVITDDLACCSRRCYALASKGNPIEAMANQMLSMPADPTVSTPYQKRFDYLVKKMEKSGARGVLVYNPKFCEPELFYIPMFEKAVKAKKLGFLHVEVEMTSEISHMVLNRINAFVEVLS